MKALTIRIVTLVALISPFSSGSFASEQSDSQIDKVMESIMKDVNSSKFNAEMQCAGVTENDKNIYLTKYEESYRHCLTTYPKNKDQGFGFLTCILPTADELWLSLNISQSVKEKCNKS